MKKCVVYIAPKQRVQIASDLIRIKDVAGIYTLDPALKNKIESELLFRFDKEKKQTRKVVSLIKTISVIDCVLEGDCEIVPLSTDDIIVERVKKKGKLAKIWSFVSVFLVCVLCLIGGAFSIMAFHNDVGLNNIFMQFYELVTGEKSSGFTILEISYSIGLMAGIVVFYDHIGKRRISKDPTPIEVSMRTYEQEMNQALMTTAEREGKMLDVS